MKTIALFGGAGRTGREFLRLALQKGYSVRALVRSPEKIQDLSSPMLTVIQGDVLNADDVARTVRGSSVVVSLFGHVKGSPPRVQTEGTRLIVAAMQAQGIGRVISLSGGGLPAPPDQPKFADKAIVFIMKIVAADVLADASEHYEVLRASGLDWTIVRGPRLTLEPATGTYRVGWVGVNASTSLGRADLADFLLKQVESGEFVGRLPFVSK